MMDACTKTILAISIFFYKEEEETDFKFFSLLSGMGILNFCMFKERL